MRFRVLLAALPAIVFTASTAQTAGGEDNVAIGVADKGVFPDLDGKVTLPLPSSLDHASVSITIDEKHALLIVWEDGRPVKPYPIGVASDAKKVKLGDLEVSVRSHD